MKKRENADHISTLLGVGTAIEGNLAFKDTIRVDGAVNGKISSEKGTLIVGERAVVEAEIRVGTAVIKGSVTGRVLASERIEIYPPAKINGDIEAPVVAIETGVLFNGNCRMTTSEPPPADKVPSGEKASAKPSA